MNFMRTFAALALIGVALSGCRREGLPSVAGRWRVAQIEWTQNDQRVKLTAEGELHMGRLKLPSRPATFEPMFQAMQHVTVEVDQIGEELSGRVEADAEAPRALLQQVGAQPGSLVARFSGSWLNDTLATVLIVAADGREREAVLNILDRGNRVVARSLPVFGERETDASDVTLIRVAG
jgi:hypothetical protein